MNTKNEIISVEEAQGLCDKYARKYRVSQAVDKTTPEERKQEVKAAFNAIFAASEAIRAVKQVPSGTLYAQLCDKLSLEAYSAIIGTLERAGVISVSNHLITWTGGAK